MRFGLRCIFWLAILYHAILSGSGGAEHALVRDAAGVARDRITSGVDAYCRRDPAGCLADAARLGALLATGAEAPAASASAGPRHRKRGAVASATP